MSELPQDRAADLGLDTSNPRSEIKVYRSPEEVFHPDTIHSFEGKAVTDNHPPGDDFVTPENFAELAMGHMQNVRKGKEPLESGEYPLVADLMITREPLLSEVRNKKKREVSCGYEFNIDRDGDVILQISMIGNHVAVVDKGRAGVEARITDSAPAEVEVEEQQQSAETPVVENEDPAGKQVVAEASQDQQSVSTEPEGDKPQTSNATQEKKPMKLSLKGLFGLGLIESAKKENADPEALADAALELSRMHKGSARANDAETAEEEREMEQGEDSRARDRRSRDRHADDRRTDDRHADDRRTDDRSMEDRHADDRRTDDSRGDDVRSRMHRQLDRMLDARDTRGNDDRGDDADMNELRSILDDYLMEESREPEHQSQSEDEIPPELVEGEAEAEGQPEGEGEDTGDELGEVANQAEVVQYTADSRANDGRARDAARRRGGDSQQRTRAADAASAAKAVLNALKPIVARSKDSAVRKAWNAQARRVFGTSETRSTGYADVAGASRDHSRARDAQPGAGEDLKDVRNFYKNAHRKPITTEVK